MAETRRPRLSFTLETAHAEFIEARRQKKRFAKLSDALRDILEDYIFRHDREIAINKTIENVQSSLTLIGRILAQQQDKLLASFEKAQRNNPEMLLMTRKLDNLESIIRDLKLEQRVVIDPRSMPSVTDDARPIKKTITPLDSDEAQWVANLSL